MKFKEHYNQEETVFIYPGRFEPFHFGHYKVYNYIKNKFNVEPFIATSNKQELPDSPFNFQDKEKIINVMFPSISPKKIVEVKKPYVCSEILENISSEKIPVCFVLGWKDKDRLVGNFYKEYDKNNLKGYKEQLYYYVVDKDNSEFLYQDEPLSGTIIREIFSDGSEKDKIDLFKNMYNCFGDYNQKIFNLLNNKINA